MIIVRLKVGTSFGTLSPVNPTITQAIYSQPRSSTGAEEILLHEIQGNRI
jgi:hypothetical protein